METGACPLQSRGQRVTTMSATPRTLAPATLLYTRIGTFITLLLLVGLAPGALAPERQIPRMNWYENLSARPRNVGGRFSGKVSEYVSARS